MWAASDPTRLWLFYIIVACGAVLLFLIIAGFGYSMGRREAELEGQVEARRAYWRGVHDGREARRG